MPDQQLLSGRQGGATQRGEEGTADPERHDQRTEEHQNSGHWPPKISLVRVVSGARRRAITWGLRRCNRAGPPEAAPPPARVGGARRHGSAMARKKGGGAP